MIKKLQKTMKELLNKEWTDEGGEANSACETYRGQCYVGHASCGQDRD